ncbi:MAG: CHAT domain-containing protein, partial [Prochlorotrichaceae cyanobacterium]
FADEEFGPDDEFSGDEEFGDDEEFGSDDEEFADDEEFSDVDFGPDDFDIDAEFDEFAYDEVDAEFDQEFSDAFDLGDEQVEGAPQTLESTQSALQNLRSVANIQPAIVSVNFTPSVIASSASGAVQTEVERQPSDNLEIILVTSDGDPLRKVLRGVTRSQVMAVSNLLRQTVGTPEGLNSDRYLVPASRLYEWLIGSIETELEAQGIDNLLFSLPAGLRSLPLAALYDGQQFLVEKYSLGLTPSVRLTDLRYTPLQDAQLVALGSEQFTDQADLPAVPIEIKTITEQIWPGDAILNENFTLDNLLQTRESGSYSIIHLATHADFEANDLGQSYIQLWDSRLRFNQLRDLQFSQGAPVELLVLSACRTALGNEEAELGFAGLAVQAGVKTSLASLWYVSDEGTLGLMTEFYRQLR